jgi:hypothetical protein
VIKKLGLGLYNAARTELDDRCIYSLKVKRRKTQTENPKYLENSKCFPIGTSDSTTSEIT